MGGSKDHGADCHDCRVYICDLCFDRERCYADVISYVMVDIIDSFSKIPALSGYFKLVYLETILGCRWITFVQLDCVIRFITVVGLLPSLVCLWDQFNSLIGIRSIVIVFLLVHVLFNR